MVFSLVNMVPPIKAALTATDIKIHWSGLDGNILDAAGNAVTTTVFKLNWLMNPGTLLLLCCIVVALYYRIDARARSSPSSAASSTGSAGRSSPWRASSRWPT